MDNKKDISFILNELKLHYNFKTNSQFADFLGISPQGLSSWYSRNTIDYDLVYSKCVDIDANWLLTGEGNMLKSREYTTSENEKKNVVGESKGVYGLENILDQEDPMFRENSLLNSVNNMSQAMIINAQAMLVNAQANEKSSTNMERILDLLTGKKENNQTENQ